MTPMKMKYSGKAPKGIPAISNGGSETKPSIMKGARAAGEKYKKPGIGGLRGRGAQDMSSSNTGPSAQSASDKSRYKGVKQPIAYSNGGTPGKTQFVC